MVIDVTARFPVLREWPRSTMSLNLMDAIVIHHTAVDPRGGEALLLPASAMSMEDELNHIAVIHLYHKSRGFGGFGYHIIVFPSGRAYLVTPLDQWGAHVAEQNDHLWGIAFAGDFYDKLPGEPQMAGAREAVDEIPKELPIRPHLYWGGTACPGRLVEILDQLKEDDMGITAEQWKLIQDNHHHTHVLIPQLLKDFETRERARYDQLRKDIAVNSGGTSLKQVLTDIVRRLKP